jgi:transposase InsO family protein
MTNSGSKFSLAEVADLTGLSRSTLKDRARREAWLYEKTTGRGGTIRLYPLESLPADLQRIIALKTMPTPPPARARDRGDVATALAQLSEKQRARFDARLAVIEALQAWRRRYGLAAKEAAHAFARAFNDGAPVVSAEIRAALSTTISGHTVLNWMRLLEKGQVEKLALANKGKHRKGSGVIDKDAEVQAVVLGMLTAHPHISCTLIMRALRTKFADAGERVPTYATVRRWVGTWKSKNAQVHLALSNPDAWRNKYMAAGGNSAEGIIRPNQLWQVDSSPFDVMCSDGRHQLIGAIDVYTRRLKFHVVRTSSADGVAHLIRKAILDWGVPAAVKSDNGQDYASKRIEDLARALGIEQDFCVKFSPWQKGHIERGFGTFQRDLVELLPGFTGHSVAQAQALRARVSFAARMGEKPAVTTHLSPADLQEFCDRWCEIYARRAHDGLKGKSPFDVLTAWQGPVMRIENERALDILIMPAPKDGGWRVVGKKGLKVEGGEYDHPKLGGREGERVFVRLDPEDIGRIYVFDTERAFICVAEDPAITGVSRAAVAAERKAHQRTVIAEQKAELKRRTKSSVVTAMEMLAHEESQAGKVTAFPKRTEIHETEDLAQAAIAAAGEQPVYRQLTPEEEAAADAEFDRLEGRTTGGDNVTRLPVPERPAEPTEQEILRMSDEEYGRWLLANRATLAPHHQANLDRFLQNPSMRCLLGLEEWGAVSA